MRQSTRSTTMALMGRDTAISDAFANRTRMLMPHGRLLALCALSMAAAAPARAADGERFLRSEAVVSAPVAEVWKAFTTEEGVESWMVPVAEVDFRLGGTLKTNYDASAKIGDPGTIVHQIVAYEPMRMIAMKTTAPENAEGFIKLACSGWGVTRFEELAADRTRVIVTGCGYGTGPEWDKAWGFFEKGNAWTLEQLRKKFARADEERKAERIISLLASCKGHWVHESTMPDGGVFRSCARYDVLDSSWVAADSWLGNAEGMAFHGRTLIYRDPETKGVQFFNLAEQGSTARGAVRLLDDNRIAYDWVVTDANGTRKPYYVEVAFEGDDAYRFKLWPSAESAGKGEKPGVEAVHNRVAEFPEAFTKLRAAGR